MVMRVVKLGSERIKGEGLRIGTVRRPPPAARRCQANFAAQNWYDVWYPNLAPSAALVNQAQAAKASRERATFLKKIPLGDVAPENSRTLDLLAALSHRANFSVGCYCEDETHCQRSELLALLIERGADLQH